MNLTRKNLPVLGVDQNIVSVLTQLYVAGQRAEDGHMPHLLTANGLRIAIEPGTNVVSLAYRDQVACELTETEAYEMATMMVAAADALRQIGDGDYATAGTQPAVGAMLSRLKTPEPASS
jgi:hypothetical protein